MVPEFIYRQQWRNSHKEQTYGHRERKERGWDVWEGVTWKLLLPYVKWMTNGNLLYVETQTVAPYQPREVGWGGEMGGDMCVY